MKVYLFMFGSDGGLYDLNILVPDHCVSFYFLNKVYQRSLCARNICENDQIVAMDTVTKSM